MDRQHFGDSFDSSQGLAFDSDGSGGYYDYCSEEESQNSQTFINNESDFIDEDEADELLSFDKGSPDRQSSNRNLKNKSRGNNQVEEEEKSFAKEESKNYDDISNSFNTDGSDYSTRVIQFDDSQNQIVGNIKKKSALEMVDLRPKANEQFREFKPSGTVNKSQKKREKAKAKKLKEKEMKAI